MTDDLDVLEPAATAVSFRGEQVEITPLTVGHLPRLVRLARPVIDALLELDPEQLARIAPVGGAPGAGADTLAVLMQLVGDHGESVIDALALCTGRKREWIASGELDEFVALAATVIGVNRDFFTRKLAPLLASQGWAGTGAGKTRSSS